MKNWDGKTDNPRDYENAEFTFTPKPKPLPADTFGDLDEEEVRDIAPKTTSDDEPVSVRDTTPPTDGGPGSGPDSGPEPTPDITSPETDGAPGTAVLDRPEPTESAEDSVTSDPEKP